MKNQLKAGVILSYVSIAITIGIQLVYMPMMIRLLGKSEYGLYSLVASVVSYLSLFSLGFCGAYLRFFARYCHNERKLATLNGMFVVLFAVFATAATICGIILSCFPEQIFGARLSDAELAKARILMLILIVNIAITLFNSIFDAMISAYEQFVFQRILGIAGAVLNPFLSLPLLLLGYDSVMLVLVTTGITLARFLVNLWFCTCQIKIPLSFHRFQWGLLKEIAVFSSFLLMNMVIDQINLNVDMLILGHTNGTEEIAVYGVAAQFNSLFLTFSTAVSSVFAPRVNHMAVQEKQGYHHVYTSLMAKIGRIQWMILGMLAGGFIVFGRYFIVHIYAGPEYEDAYFAALVLILPALIPWIQNIGIEMQRALNKHQFRSIVYFIIAIGNIIVSIPLAVRYGVRGVTIGTMISILIGNGVIMNFYYHKVLKINMLYFWKEIFKTWKGFLIPGVVSIFIMRFVLFENVSVFFIWCMIYAIIYSISIFCFSCNEEEKRLIFDFLHSNRKG